MEVKVSVYIDNEDIIKDVIKHLDNDLSDGFITVEQIENDLYEEELNDIIDNFFFFFFDLIYAYDVLNIDSIISQIKNSQLYQEKLKEILDNYKNI